MDKSCYRMQWSVLSPLDIAVANASHLSREAGAILFHLEHEGTSLLQMRLQANEKPEALWRNPGGGRGVLGYAQQSVELEFSEFSTVGAG